MRQNKNFILNVHQLIKNQGMTCSKSIVADPTETWETGLLSIRGLVRVEVDLQSNREGILTRGKILSSAVGDCARCLKELIIPLEVEFVELIAYYLGEAYEYRVLGERVDLAPLCRDYLLSSLPFSPVCGDGCSGGARFVSAGSDGVDPRWSALLKYKECD